MGNPDPRELMVAIRERLVRRVGEPMGDASEALPASTRSQGASPLLSVIAPVESRDRYALSELLAYPDRLFVENAYRAVLKREPDASGLDAHLGALRRGDITKVGLLGLLMASEEAKAFGVRVDGLERPLKLERLRRTRGIGRLAGWLSAALRLDEHARRNGLMANRHEQLIVTSLDTGTAAAAGQHMVEARLDSIRGQFIQLRDDLQHEVAGLSDQLRDDLQHEVARLSDSISQLTRQVKAHAEVIAHLTSENSVLRSELESRVSMLAQTESESLERYAALAARVDALEPASVEDAPVLDGMYVEFERRFRGNPELIRARMQPHLAWVREAAAGTRERPVLDIGCGAGDWLDLLRAEHFIAKGVDTNRIFVELCRGRGLDASLGDGIRVLRDLPDNTCGALTSIHVVEHLPFESLINLLDEALRVLAPGGVLILETPNPENLTVATLGFYMDPTHRNPLPPEMLRWVVEARGFSDSRIERLTAARELALPAFLPPDIPGSGSVNALISHLAQAPDYAIVARKLP